MDNREEILASYRAPGMPTPEEAFKKERGEEFNPNLYEIVYDGAENYLYDDSYTPYRIVRREKDIQDDVEDISIPQEISIDIRIIDEKIVAAKKLYELEMTSSNKRKITMLEKKRKEIIDDYNLSVELGITYDYYKEITKTLSKKKALREILESRGLKEVLEKRRKTDIDKEIIRTETIKIIQEIINYREKETVSLVETIRVLYNKDVARTKRKPRTIKKTEKEVERIRKSSLEITTREISEAYSSYIIDITTLYKLTGEEFIEQRKKIEKEINDLLPVLPDNLLIHANEIAEKIVSTNEKEDSYEFTDDVKRDLELIDEQVKKLKEKYSLSDQVTLHKRLETLRKKRETIIEDYIVSSNLSISYQFYHNLMRVGKNKTAINRILDNEGLYDIVHKRSKTKQEKEQLEQAKIKIIREIESYSKKHSTTIEDTIRILYGDYAFTKKEKPARKIKVEEEKLKQIKENSQNKYSFDNMTDEEIRERIQDIWMEMDSIGGVEMGEDDPLTQEFNALNAQLKKRKEKESHTEKKEIDSSEKSDIDKIFSDETPTIEKQAQVFEQEKKQKRTISEIINEISNGLEVNSEELEYYRASNIKISNKFKEEIKSNNILYKLKVVSSRIISAAGLFLLKLSSKILCSRNTINAIQQIKARIDQLSQEDLETLFKEFNDSSLKNEIPNAVLIAIEKKLQEYKRVRSEEELKEMLSYSEHETERVQSNEINISQGAGL